MRNHREIGLNLPGEVHAFNFNLNHTVLLSIAGLDFLIFFQHFSKFLTLFNNNGKLYLVGYLSELWISCTCGRKGIGGLMLGRSVKIFRFHFI